MKECSKCHIHVGGEWECCPLCQGELTGTATENIFPAVRPAAGAYRLFLQIVTFLFLCACVICACINWMTSRSFDWSLMVAVCGFCGWLLLRTALHSGGNVPRILFSTVLITSIAVYLCDRMTGYTRFSINYVIPICCSAALVGNIVISIIQRKKAMVYLLLNIIAGCVPWILMLSGMVTRQLPTMICLMISITTFLGLLIFRGKTLISELHRRLHL